MTTFDHLLKLKRDCWEEFVQMIYNTKDLSSDQKAAIEGLIGRTVGESEVISIRAVAKATAPEWLQSSWKTAESEGLDRLSSEEIDAEISSVRKARRDRRSSLEQ